MRVATKTIYDMMKFSLGQRSSELIEANNVIATGKRINRLSDDPIGLTQVLNLKSTISGLDQLDRNILAGRNWLTVSETALGSVEDLVSDTKILCVELANDSVNAQQRQDAVEQINGTLSQIVDIANTTINGQYIFGGTKTDLKPFVVDDEQNPTKVTYQGSEEAFKIKLGKDSTLPVGISGLDIFWENTVTIDATNNKIDFKENLGENAQDLTATIADGEYSASELANVLGLAMSKVSDESGCNIAYDVSYDSISQKFTIQSLGFNDGETSPEDFSFQLLWASGEDAGESIGPDLGFSAIDVTGTSITSDNEVEWGIFDTLIDLKSYLENNDTDGIARSMARLDTHYENLISTVSNIGQKELRLDMKESIMADLDLSYTERRVNLEEADIIEAIADLSSREIAYQAILASSSKVMQLSLLDYM